MKLGERWRLRFVFGLLGMVPVCLAGRLGYLQVLQAGELPRNERAPLRLVTATADAQGARAEKVPAPRGTIVDRSGQKLAVDRDVYEVRARIAVPIEAQKNVLAYCRYLAGLAEDFARALATDPQLANRAEAEAEARKHLLAVFGREFRTGDLAGIADPATAKLPEKQPCVGDVRIAAEVDDLATIAALRELDDRRKLVGLDLIRGHARSYPERELTHGIVGHLDTKWVTPAGADTPVLQTVGVCGLEALPELEAGIAGARAFRLDGKGRPYFLAPVPNSSKPTVVHSTIDLDLQRFAQRELAAKAEAGAINDGGKRPLWGALLLIEVETGDVLAAASWQRDVADPKQASWTPYQMLYEPGSIVKPLVFAYALEAGRVDWNHVYDCASGSADYRERIASLGRRKPVKDDHDCHELTPHGILVNSSNIGATYVGLGLDREQWQDYMRFYGIGQPLGFEIPNGRRGGTHPKSFDPAIPLRSFRANSAVSFSFGYELQVTAFHIARAYLRLFRGDASELRICRGVELDGEWHPAPISPVGTRYSERTIELVRDALVDVVSSEEHATGAQMHREFLKETGIDLHGLVGGKTGTAASDVGLPGRGKISMRNASFVGFLPVENPRWLAVCVMQKDDSAKFYGGNYAAPSAVRLLLQAERLAERRALRQELQGGSDGQVRPSLATPGTQAGAEGLQGQRR